MNERHPECHTIKNQSQLKALASFVVSYLIFLFSYYLSQALLSFSRVSCLLMMCPKCDSLDFIMNKDIHDQVFFFTNVAFLQRKQTRKLQINIPALDSHHAGLGYSHILACSEPGNQHFLYH